MIVKVFIPEAGTRSFTIMKSVVLASPPDATSVSAGPPSPHSGRHSAPVTLSRVVSSYFPRVCVHDQPVVLYLGQMWLLMRFPWGTPSSCALLSGKRSAHGNADGAPARFV